MIIRQNNFKLPPMFLFNAGVAIFLLGTAVLATRTLIVKEPPPACAESYANAMAYVWTRPDGSALTPEDLQSRMGGRDRGVMDNVRFVPVESGPAKIAMQVMLKKDQQARPHESERSGMSFTWLPRDVRTAQSACLSYSVWVPAKSDVPFGISLPGLFGDDDAGTDDGSDPAFSSRMRWRGDGKAELTVTSPAAPNGSAVEIEPNWLELKRGRWVRFDTEIGLNSPGQSDGLLRVWVDGKNYVDRNNMLFRTQNKQGFRGVVAAVHYSRIFNVWAPVPKATYVLVSPFELRWR